MSHPIILSEHIERECPFCEAFGDEGHLLLRLESNATTPPTHWVVCDVCGTEGPVMKHGQTEMEAVKAWDQRPLEPYQKVGYVDERFLPSISGRGKYVPVWGEAHHDSKTPVFTRTRP